MLCGRHKRRPLPGDSPLQGPAYDAHGKEWKSCKWTAIEFRRSDPGEGQGTRRRRAPQKSLRQQARRQEPPRTGKRRDPE
eukprot:6911552-Heterocapsa_arctica.AAC.1